MIRIMLIAGAGLVALWLIDKQRGTSAGKAATNNIWEAWVRREQGFREYCAEKESEYNFSKRVTGFVTRNLGRLAAGDAGAKAGNLAVDTLSHDFDCGIDAPRIVLPGD